MEERRESLRKSLGVASLDNTFEALKPWPGTEKCLAAFKAMAEGTTDKPLLLGYGGVGNGKTRFCEATVIALYKRGILCSVFTMAGVMRALRNAIEHDKHRNYGKPWVPYNDLLNSFCNRNHLIIDDIGLRGTVSDGERDWDVKFEYTHLEEILLVRYRERLFTIMTTNRDLEELPERIVSRFSDPDVGRVVLNEGEDFRRRK